MAIIPGKTGQNIIIDTPQKQKNRKLRLLLVATIILTGAVIYFGFGKKGDQSKLTAPLPEASLAMEQEINRDNRILEALAGISLNNPIFKDKKFQSLIQNDQLPVAVGIKGRENPFLPF
ncbi:hypothetical protein KJ866_00795 [Patescibacteria group bacterium]|nr:hypothetical protein [Patescibacteria group bacterium]MBU2219650.1 hypothetical protein [Patescibacteria group bacterium]MBU2265100.1 hypothetical protein [Patescibacteria group bacterium]